MKTTKHTKKNAKKTAIYITLALILAGAGAVGIVLANGQDKKAETIAALPTPTQTDKSDEAVIAGKGIVINKEDITEKATFYPYRSGDTDMEVIAVRASDGTVKTALNTCQVCFDSGRGYYKQEGNVLVCQNCGNKFSVDQVEVAKGGCNPVPVFDDQKTQTDKTITISDETLAQYKPLFGNWKK